MNKPLVTAIVSTFNAERFMAACIDDLTSQTIGQALEIVVIDSGSTENEAAICRSYMSRHANIHYVRTEREGLYSAWNRAIQLAQGKYLTSANTDDRHRSDAFERLATALENAPKIALAYGDQYVSGVENEDFVSCASRGNRIRRWPEFSPDDLLLRCIVGSQPMWRRDLHQRHGLFDDSFRIAGDYEFWIRLAQTEHFLHIAEPLGVFYESPASISGSNNRHLLDTETTAIQIKYLKPPPWNNNPVLRKRLAEVIFARGYHYIEKKKDIQRAMPFLRQAWQFSPGNIRYIKTILVRSLIGTSFRN